jgi:hypothetical protein
MNDQQPKKNSRFELVGCTVLFGSIAAIAFNSYQSGNWANDLSTQVFIYGVLFMFPVLTFISLVAAIQNWPIEKAENVLIWTAVSIVVGAPLLLLALVLFASGASAALGSAPAWAVVIIVLLVLILLRMK